MSAAPICRAWLSDQPGVAHMTLVERPMPVVSASELLVQVACAALNFSDLLMLNDTYQVRPPRPFVPGQEISGTVVEAAPQTGFRAGDRVAGKVEWGGFSSHALMRADMAIPIPPGVAFDVAAALPVAYITAVVALTVCTPVRRDETVLVLAGAGGVGMAAVDIARAVGARVMAAVGGPAKAQLVLQRGAHAAVDYGNPAWLEQVRAFNDRGGVDVIVDPVGGVLARDALSCLGWMGRYLVVGFASGEIPQIPANRLLLKRASAIGVYWNHDRDAAMLRGVCERLTGWLADGVIHPHVGARFTFAQAPEAIAALQSRGTTGKVVLMAAP
ncbi:MAG: NADPH:quinone oxidoreductase family protein [Burkholderiaceae bacterium]